MVRPSTLRKREEAADQIEGVIDHAQEGVTGLLRGGDEVGTLRLEDQVDSAQAVAAISAC